MKGNNNQLEKNTQPKGEITMKNKMSKVLKNEKGLTLIELLAVIVILAIVSAIAIPAIGNIVENSRYNAVKADAVNVLNASNLYFTDNASETTVLVSKMISDKYLETSGKIPGATGADTTITKANPNKISTTGIKFSGNKTVTFNGATITGINNDSTKGSAIATNQEINQ